MKNPFKNALTAALTVLCILGVGSPAAHADKVIQQQQFIFKKNFEPWEVYFTSWSDGTKGCSA